MELERPGVHPLGAVSPKFYAGLDIGQMADPSALAILEREILDTGTRVEGRFLLRYLERVPLMTPYPVMVDGVHQRLEAIHEPCTLIVDATGVGRPVVDMFRTKLLLPIAVTITTGERVTSERFDEWHVPKRLLIMGMQVAMQQGRLRVAASLKEGPVFVRELQQFQWKPTRTNQDSYGAWREGAHDDLILAVAVALWYSSRFLPTGARPRHSQQQYATGPGNPLKREHRTALTSRGR
jgi:hypothetical protein